jgi:hypothetical protein
MPIVETIENHAYELKDESSIILNGVNDEGVRNFLNKIIDGCNAVLERKHGQHIFIYVYDLFDKCGTSLSQMRGCDTPRFRDNYYSLVYVLRTINTLLQDDKPLRELFFNNKPELQILHSTLKCAIGKARKMLTLLDDVRTEIRMIK